MFAKGFVCYMVYHLFKDCPPGTYWNAVSTECEGCPEGQYQPDYGQLSCLTCSAGSEPTEDRTDCSKYTYFMSLWMCPGLLIRSVT